MYFLTIEQPLLEYSFRERRSLLREHFRPLKRPNSAEMAAQFDFVENCESVDGKSSIEDFLLKAIENKCEGLMFKASILKIVRCRLFS